METPPPTPTDPAPAPRPASAAAPRDERRPVEAARLDPNDPHAPAPGEVREFLDDARRFWAVNGTWIATTLCVFAVVYFGWNFYQSRQASTLENAWADLYGVNSQSMIDLVAEDPGTPAVETLALLRGGDIALNEHQKLAEPEADAGAELLSLAESRYTAALDAAPADLYRLNALEGLAVVAESRRDADAARGFYEQLKQAAGDRYPQWVARTDRRLERLADLPGPVAFAPALNPPAAEGGDEPASEPEADAAGPTADTNPDDAAPTHEVTVVPVEANDAE